MVTFLIHLINKCYILDDSLKTVVVTCFCVRSHLGRPYLAKGVAECNTDCMKLLVCIDLQARVVGAQQINFEISSTFAM